MLSDPIWSAPATSSRVGEFEPEREYPMKTPSKAAVVGTGMLYVTAVGGQVYLNPHHTMVDLAPGAAFAAVSSSSSAAPGLPISIAVPSTILDDVVYEAEPRRKPVAVQEPAPSATPAEVFIRAPRIT
jgi:hypothetical protein